LLIIFVSSGEWFGAVHLDEATGKFDPARETMKESDMNAKLTALALAGLMSAATYAAEPDTEVIEYYHPVLKHYFITASASDARVVDSGAAGKEWVRTGRSFSAWSKRDNAPEDTAMVHRFYSPGAISHFFSANEAEIRMLREMEANERASIAGTDKSFRGWGYEGEAFVAVIPKNGQCPSGTEVITRTYNRGGLSVEDGSSNHRYINGDSLIRSMEDRNWVIEGAVFCASTSASASASSSSTGSASPANGSAVASGSYSGTVEFKIEVLGKPEVKVMLPVTLTLAANGAISGAGGGCQFAGSTAAPSATEARLRGGSVSATGCDDARFNGNYGRIEIEQFGAKAIDIRFKQGDNAREVQIEGVLTTASSVTTPTPNPTAASNAQSITGDFAGIAGWLITERAGGQQERIVFNVNQRLALKITNAGAVSGNGLACTFSGTLVPGIDNRFTGSVLASGCSEARLNGSYEATVHPEDAGAIEAELEREVEQGGLRTKVSIKGNLAGSTSGTTTPPPPPPPAPSASGIAIAGKFTGDATWLATRRPAGGRETTEVSRTQNLQVAISGTGDVAGAGAGCSFAGKLSSSNPTLGIFAGTVTATACTDSIIRGTYSATATREDGNAVELELERETEIGGERVKVKIKGRLTKQ
jgi:hypothetical protein